MASGDTLAIFTPQQNEPPASNYATLDTRNAHLVLDFDDTTNETAVFKGVMPQNYDGGGFTVRIFYALTSATTGDTDWDAGFERVADSIQDIDSDGFAAVNSVDTTTVPGTSGHVDVVSITFSDGADADSVTAGDGFRIKITRDATNDSASGDAELWAVEVQET
jgi:hypothetical protein